MRLGTGILALGVAGCLLAAGVARAEPAVEVRIGPSAGTAESTKEHDLTVGALEEARRAGTGGEFWMQTPGGETFKIVLDREQIEALLDGLRVLVDTKQGDDGNPPRQRVVLTLEENGRAARAVE